MEVERQDKPTSKDLSNIFQLNSREEKLLFIEANLLFQNTMNLPPDKMKILSQYDNDKKWDLICDQVGFRGTVGQNHLSPYRCINNARLHSNRRDNHNSGKEEKT